MNLRHLPTKQILIAGLLAASLAACGGSSTAGSPAGTSDTATESQSSPSTQEAPAGDSTEVPADAGDISALLAAADTARAAVANATVVSIDRNTSTWEVHVITPDGKEHELDVALAGDRVERGPVLDQDDADDLAEQKALVQAKTVTFAAAAERALAAVPQGRLTDLDLESHDGRIVWEAQVLDDQQIERSLRLDAASGELLSNEYDD